MKARYLPAWLTRGLSCCPAPWMAITPPERSARDVLSVGLFGRIYKLNLFFTSSFKTFPMRFLGSSPTISTDFGAL